MTKIISRSEAKAAGLTRYFTGEPCNNGHVAERGVASKHCMQCLAANKKAQRAANPEKTKELDRQRRASNYEKRREIDRRRRAANPEKERERLRHIRLKKRFAKVYASIDRGLQSATASGAILDIATAIDLFKTDGNAFDIIDDINVFNESRIERIAKYGSWGS